jgi:hypothetical protein
LRKTYVNNKNPSKLFNSQVGDLQLGQDEVYFIGQCPDAVLQPSLTGL